MLSASSNAEWILETWNNVEPLTIKLGMLHMTRQLEFMVLGLVFQLSQNGALKIKENTEFKKSIFWMESLTGISTFLMSTFTSKDMLRSVQMLQLEISALAEPKKYET